MAISKSSSTWLQKHFKDKHVKQSRQDGYRSRACYKLIALNKKDKLIRPNMTIIDLGSAPGSWSQLARKLVNNNGRVIASDILFMDTIAGVEFIQGDFTEPKIFGKIIRKMAGLKADLVISDMAPNMSGIADIDQPRSMCLVELALSMAMSTLNKDGYFVTKVFHGEGFNTLLNQMRKCFKHVLIRKPEASRACSREVYWVAKGLRI